MKYKNFQFSYLITILFLMFMIFMTFSWYYQWGINPVSTGGFVFFVILFLLILLNFYGMTTIITNREIIIKFGVGLIRKKILLEKIESISATDYPVWYGYGIRITPMGWLYNVSGRQAVEIKIIGKKYRILIGTREQEYLLQGIRTGMNSGV